jgi:hypothetical protein
MSIHRIGARVSMRDGNDRKRPRATYPVTSRMYSQIWDTAQ